MSMHPDTLRIKNALIALGFKRDEFSVRMVYGRNRRHLYSLGTFRPLDGESRVSINTRAAALAPHLTAQKFHVAVHSDSDGTVWATMIDTCPGLRGSVTRMVTADEED